MEDNRHCKWLLSMSKNSRIPFPRFAKMQRSLSTSCVCLSVVGSLVSMGSGPESPRVGFRIRLAASASGPQSSVGTAAVQVSRNETRSQFCKKRAGGQCMSSECALQFHHTVVRTQRPGGSVTELAEGLLEGHDSEVPSKMFKSLASGSEPEPQARSAGAASLSVSTTN
jgi:hypothetical protein